MSKKGRQGKHFGSRLKDHRQDGKTLVPPYARLPAEMTLSSWRDERLPEMIWAALISVGLSREEYLSLFREIAASTAENKELKFEGMGHSRFADLTVDEFDALLAPLLRSKSAMIALKPLRLLPDLPDHSHWVRHLPDSESSEDDWRALGEAMAANAWHQSEAATDIRWLRVLTMIAGGKMVFPKNLADHAREIIEYPNIGDLRSVRPSIRASEMAFCSPEHAVDSNWPKTFWNHCFRSTNCMPAPMQEPKTIDVRPMIDETLELYRSVAAHFYKSVDSTDIDERLDSTFGLVLYSIVIQLTLLSSESHLRVQGRLLIRTLVEVYITLSFLVKKDDSIFWKRYRNYGSGQAKLAFLKLIDLEGDDIPSYVNADELEQLANEDKWQEFLEIDIGSWAKKDLRKMSEEAGVKDVYDKYYAWPSGFVHGQWASVRNTVFDMCINPLHRYHRIPAPPRLDMGSVAPDGAKIINRLLNLLSEAYPPFKVRLKVKDGVAIDEAPKKSEKK